MNISRKYWGRVGGEKRVDVQFWWGIIRGESWLRVGCVGEVFVVRVGSVDDGSCRWCVVDTCGGAGARHTTNKSNARSVRLLSHESPPSGRPGRKRCAGHSIQGIAYIEQSNRFACDICAANITAFQGWNNDAESDLGRIHDLSKSLKSHKGWNTHARTLIGNISGHWTFGIADRTRPPAPCARSPFVKGYSLLCHGRSNAGLPEREWMLRP